VKASQKFPERGAWHEAFPRPDYLFKVALGLTKSLQAALDLFLHTSRKRLIKLALVARRSADRCSRTAAVT
jgi:hypothetical protein